MRRWRTVHQGCRCDPANPAVCLPNFEYGIFSHRLGGEKVASSVDRLSGARAVQPFRTANVVHVVEKKNPIFWHVDVAFLPLRRERTNSQPLTPMVP